MFKALKISIKQGFSVLLDPRKEYQKLGKIQFEKVVANYMWLLISLGVIFALANLVYSLLRAFYLEATLTVSIDYFRMLNYALGQSSSLIFFYIFAGTFLMFFVSLIIRPFFKFSYIDQLKILFYALTPVIVFGWVPPTPIPFLVWSGFLYYLGVKNYKPQRISKKSIKNRA